MLRFSPAPPPGLEAHLPLHAYQAIIRDINHALRPRDGCVSKGAGITIFILLFYTTFIGIFFYMCAEHACNRRALAAARRGVVEACVRHSAALAPLGLRVTPRFNPLLPEALDTGVGEDGQAEKSYSFLCFSLLHAPQAAGAPWVGGAASAPPQPGAFYPAPFVAIPMPMTGEPKCAP